MVGVTDFDIMKIVSIKEVYIKEYQSNRRLQKWDQTYFSQNIIEKWGLSLSSTAIEIWGLSLSST